MKNDILFMMIKLLVSERLNDRANDSMKVKKNLKTKYHLVDRLLKQLLIISNKFPGETHSVGSCQAQKISIGSSWEVVGFLEIGFRLADSTGIPIKYDRILSCFIGFYRILTISGPESDYRIECPGFVLLLKMILVLQ